MVDTNPYRAPATAESDQQDRSLPKPARPNAAGEIFTTLGMLAIVFVIAALILAVLELLF